MDALQRVLDRHRVSADLVVCRCGECGGEPDRVTIRLRRQLEKRLAAMAMGLRLF